MNTYGLVLAGGGGKGAYQLGAWKALTELGITFEAISGTSIGSINGALIAAGDYEAAREFWRNVSVDKGVRFSQELPDSDNLFSKKNWGVLFREFIKNGGFDASPTEEFVSSFVDEGKVRASGIDFGIVTVQVTQGVVPREIFLEDIPEGQLVDYLMASSNIPLATNIGPEGERFLDGGAYDNTPVMTLKKRGYNRLIIVDISNIKGVAHNLNFLNSEIVHIRPYDLDELGASFDFDDAVIERRISFGYLDTRKAFSLLLGNIYYFEPVVFKQMVREIGADTLLQLEEMAHILQLEKINIYTKDEFISRLKQAYLTELQQQARREKEEKEKNEKESFVSQLRKRFADKKNFDEVRLATQYIEDLITPEEMQAALTVEEETV